MFPREESLIFTISWDFIFHLGQTVGIPMRTSCAPLLADLFLYSYENEFLDKLIKEGKKKLARKVSLISLY